jgi:hypothetical protein
MTPSLQVWIEPNLLIELPNRLMLIRGKPEDRNRTLPIQKHRIALEDFERTPRGCDRQDQERRHWMHDNLTRHLRGTLDQLPSERSAGEARLVSGMHREVVRLD